MQGHSNLLFHNFVAKLKKNPCWAIQYLSPISYLLLNATDASEYIPIYSIHCRRVCRGRGVSGVEKYNFLKTVRPKYNFFYDCQAELCLDLCENYPKTPMNAIEQTQKSQKMACGEFTCPYHLCFEIPPNFKRKQRHKCL